MTNQDVARGLIDGLNGDPDQTAAQLLIDAVHGVWLAKLTRWPDYLRERTDTSRGGGLWIDWPSSKAWADSYTGRHASEDDYERRRDEVPRRPWHGASRTELVILNIALALAPGGLLGDGLPRLDGATLAAVLAAVTEVSDGEFIDPPHLTAL